MTPRLKEDVTLKDIAEAVGKSVAAVSRALNDYDDISEETRLHVKEVAEKMGYTPNRMAQRLRRRATDTLGFILPALSPRNADPYYSELLTGIAAEAAQHRFDLLVTTSPGGSAELQTYQRLIRSRRIDGIIVARPRWQDERIKLLLDKQIPLVVLGHTDISEEIPTVSDDPTEGGRIMVEHLLEQQYEQIALVNASLDLIFASHYLAGFRSALVKANLTVDDSLLEESNFTQADGYGAAQRLLSRKKAPTAIMTADDIVAMGVMAAVQDQGFEVGSDIAVTGYGDILLSEHAQPPLTTLHRPTYTMGQQACRMLIAQLRKEPIPEKHVVFKPSIVIRQSSTLSLWL